MMILGKVLVVLGAVVLADCHNYDVTQKVLFPILPSGAIRSDNQLCKEESKMYMEQLDNLTLWAHEMWDATAKSTEGILRGSTFQMGDFDECITVKAPFVTQYCLATIKAHVPLRNPRKDPLSLHFHPHDSVLARIHETNDKTQQTRHIIQAGWCVPASCTPQDLEKSLNKYLSIVEHPLISENVTYTASVNKEACQTDIGRRHMDGADIGFCLLVILLAVCVTAATVYDFNQEEELKEKTEKKPLMYKLCMAFSVRRNFLDLPKAEESNPALRILYGTRTFCILMIIMDHRFGTYLSGPMINFDYIEKEYRSAAAWFLFHGDLFVDSFFILSGILVTYGMLTQLDKKFVNPGFVIFLRYIRLTPVYAFVIYYYATVFDHVGSGPMWKMVVSPEVQDCRKNWYLNLLYISNYIKDDHMCMVHSWYLPCDFHYFIIGMFICILISKRKKYGLGILCVFTTVALAIPFAITIIYRREALLQFFPEFLTNPKQHPEFRMTYSKTHTRATPYFVGMFAGYFYYKAKQSEKQFSKIKSHIITLVSIILLLGSMVGGAVFYNPYHQYNPLEAAAYASLHRLSWAIGTVGLLIVCSYGHAVALQKCLTWSPWIPLSKLVYGAYLSHMQFQLRNVGMTPGPKFFNYFDVVSLALGDWVLAFSTALVLYLGVESPFRKIFKELLMPARKHVAPVQPTSTVPETALRESIINNGDCDSRL